MRIPGARHHMQHSVKNPGGTGCVLGVYLLRNVFAAVSCYPVVRFRPVDHDGTVAFAGRRFGSGRMTWHHV